MNSACSRLEGAKLAGRGRSVYSGLGDARLTDCERSVYSGLALGIMLASCARSVYSGLGGARLRGWKKSVASLAAAAAAASASWSAMEGLRLGFPSEETWTGSLRWRVVDVAVAPGVLTVK